MSWTSRHNLLVRSVNRQLGGVSVIWGAVSGDAILEQNGDLILGDQVISTKYALHNLPSSMFGGLSYGDVISVDGESYRVIHEPLKQGDGLFCIAPLEKFVPAVMIGLITADTLITDTFNIFAGVS